MCIIFWNLVSMVVVVLMLGLCGVGSYVLCGGGVVQMQQEIKWGCNQNLFVDKVVGLNVWIESYKGCVWVQGISDQMLDFVFCGVVYNFEVIRCS